MKNEKILGKIDFAEFGRMPNKPFMFGLILSFDLQRSSVMSGSKYTINISESCDWDSREEKLKIIEEEISKLNNILEDADVNYISELAGKPVEVEIENNMFKGFRILTEVI